MIRKAARNALALVCLLVGIAGLFLPFIQGIAMIVLALVVADFEAKERLLERYRHTRVGRHLWERHEARKARDAARRGSTPAPEFDPEPDSETLPLAALEPVGEDDGGYRSPPAFCGEERGQPRR